MKPLFIALWIQVLAGFACMLIAFGEMHSGAMSYEWTNRVRAEYKNLYESRTLKAPPEVGGVEHARFPEVLHSLAEDSMHNAGYWFIFSCAVLVAGGTMLVLAYRAQKATSK